MPREISSDLYNTAIGYVQALEDDKSSRREHDDARETELKAIEELTRELCESILANVPKEMKLGQAYAWAELPIKELLRKAISAQKELNKKQADRMRRFMNKHNKVCMEKAALERKIRELITSQKSSQKTKLDVPQTTDDILKEDEKKKKEKKALDRAQKDIKDAAAAGNVVFQEDPGDMGSAEDLLLNDAINDAEKLKPRHTKVSKPVRKSPRTEAKERGMHNKAEKEANLAYIDLQNFTSKINDIGWMVLRVMGEQGISKMADIQTKVLDNGVGESLNQVRSNIYSLMNAGIISPEDVKTPNGSFRAFELSDDVGKPIFETKFKKRPVVSEAQKIRSQHDNLTHGYSIVMLSQSLEKFKDFQKIDIYRRRKKVKTGHGQSFIPDILIEDTNNVKIYIEYECGTTPQTEFNSKCNKMAAVTNTLNFVAPNKDVVKNLKVQVDKWVKSKGDADLSGIKVRIAGFKAVTATEDSKQNVDIRKDEHWQFVYDFKDGNREPVQNF